MNQQQLQEYIIDRGQSKNSYFLFYKHEEPLKAKQEVVNNPLKSTNFLEKLHAEVRVKERQYAKTEDIISEEEEQEDKNKQLRPDEKGKKETDEKKLDYFGQFKPKNIKKTIPSIKL